MNTNNASFKTNNFGLTVEDLHVNYRHRQVLDGVNLHAQQGRVYALLGLNGAGKSTLFNAVLGMVQPAHGRIAIHGQDWTRASLDHIGASVNGPALFPQLSATKNLLVHARLLGTDPAHIPALLDMVGLGNTGRQKAKSFSTGMKVRLSLAIALLGDPSIVILDEPQNGLDPQGITYLRGLIRALADRGKTVIISSHQLGEVARMADDIGVLSGGRIVYEGPLANLAPTDDSLEAAFNNLVAGGA